MRQILRAVVAVFTIHGTLLAQDQCNPQIDSPGVCLFKQGRYALAVGQLHAEVSTLTNENADVHTVANRYLWMGAAYAAVGQMDSAREAFRQALAYDRTVRLEALDPYATDQMKQLFVDAAKLGGRDPEPWQRNPPSVWVRLGVMSGFTLLRPGQPGRYQQPLSLNVHALVGFKRFPLGLFVGSGASPNLPGAAIVGLGYRPVQTKPLTIFAGYRLRTDRSAPRLAAGVGVDFRLPR